MKKYEVLVQLGSPTDGIITKEHIKDLENKLNSKAEEGWKVISCTESNVSLKGNEIHRLLIIIEKDE